MVGTRHGRYAQLTEGLLRSTVLDAVGDLLADSDWDRLSMSTVAREAGVSRQTLYNEFDSREGLAEAYVIREAGDFLDAVEGAFDAHTDSLVDAVGAALRVVLETGESHPVLRSVLSGTCSPVLIEALVGANDGTVTYLATVRVAGIIEQRWPSLSTDDVRLLADAITRLAVSHLTQPHRSVEDAVAGMLRVLGPFLRELSDS